MLPTNPPFYTMKFFTQNSREELKLVSGFSFTCNKYPSQFTDDKSNDSSLREGIGLEGDTNFILGREGFSLLRLAFVAWDDFHARLHVACSRSLRKNGDNL